MFMSQKIGKCDNNVFPLNKKIQEVKLIKLFQSIFTLRQNNLECLHFHPVACIVNISQT